MTTAACRLMNVRLKISHIQATRNEPAQKVRRWNCEAMPGTTCPWVCVATLDDARKLAKQHGFDGILL